MIDHTALRQSARRASFQAASITPTPKVGDEIFEGTSYPRSWDAYIGQAKAKAQLEAACYSARLRRRRLDHVLIATGEAGIGKTALAKLIAADLGTGLIEVQGALDEKEGMAILQNMAGNDVLFWDEIHRAVSNGKAKAEWLLSVLQDGVMMTKRGPVRIPDITIVAATTDAQKLPQTILSRFVIRPVMERYTEDEATLIALGMAASTFDPAILTMPNEDTCRRIVRAANHNPREIDVLLRTLRDSAIGGLSLGEFVWDALGNYDILRALEWAGTTEDGLPKLAQDYLTVLMLTFDGTAGEKTIASALGEPTVPRHTEQLLVGKGLLTVTASGRQLTEMGVERTVRLLRERGLIEQIDEGVVA